MLAENAASPPAPLSHTLSESTPVWCTEPLQKRGRYGIGYSRISQVVRIEQIKPTVESPQGWLIADSAPGDLGKQAFDVAPESAVRANAIGDRVGDDVGTGIDRYSLAVLHIGVHNQRDALAREALASPLNIWSVGVGRGTEAGLPGS